MAYSIDLQGGKSRGLTTAEATAMPVYCIDSQGGKSYSKVETDVTFSVGTRNSHVIAYESEDI